MEKRKVSKLFFILTILFFYIPLFVLIIFSFNKGKSINWEGFSTKWYKELFYNSDTLWRAFKNSMIIAFFSAIISTIIGTLGAISMYWYQFGYKRYLEIITYLPLMMPDIIIGISLLIFFVGIHLNLGIFTIFLAHTTFNIPYVLFIVLSRLDDFDYNIIEASYDLGANEKQTLLKVIFPMIMPGVISALLMAFTLSFDDFVITFFVSGPGSSTLPLHIYSMIKFGVSPVINSLAVLLIIITFIIVLISNKLQKKEELA